MPLLILGGVGSAPSKYAAACEMWIVTEWQTDSTLKINQTVKLVKLFEKMFNMNSIVLKTLFPFINAVVDGRLSHAPERVSAGELFQNSTWRRG